MSGRTTLSREEAIKLTDPATPGLSVHGVHFPGVDGPVQAKHRYLGYLRALRMFDPDLYESVVAKLPPAEKPKGTCSPRLSLISTYPGGR